MRTLAELQAAGLPKAKLTDIWEHAPTLAEPQPEEGSPEYVRAINDLLAVEQYVAGFVPPKEIDSPMLGPIPLESGACPSCEKPLGGFLGTFTWGLVHGEGRCSNCGWPCRAYHRVHRDGKLVVRFEFLLAYHPSVLKERER